MAQAYLDHPGDVTWFKGYGPADVLGPCPHDCDHRALSSIAWGPDFERYTLNVCDVDDGCAGRCRGWAAEYPAPFTAGPKFRLGPMLMVGTGQQDTP